MTNPRIEKKLYSKPTVTKLSANEVTRINALNFDIILKHIGGERKVVPVEYVSPNLAYISIRWGQSGIYDLNLTKNVLTARSQKAQRKGKAYWTADDIDAVKRAAFQYLEAKRDKPVSIDEAYLKHMKSMPFRASYRDMEALPEEIEEYPNYSSDHIDEI
jgi:hypothetical protein